MSAAHNDKVPDLGSLYLGKDTANRLAMIFGVVGLLGLGLTALSGFSEAGRSQALHSYLVAFFFCMTIALGGLFFTMLQHIVGAVWSVVVRRISEAMAATIPVLIVLLLPIVLSTGTLYREWAGNEVHEPAVVAKAAYLNVPFFLARAAVYVVTWGALAFVFYRRSLELDKTGDPHILLGLRKLSAPGIILFALTLTFAAFDWLMSLDPTWYSTMFGVYIFAGTFLSGMSVMVLIALLLRRAGLLTDVITAEHYHDLGKLIFAFIVFWTYIAFSQYMLIWYANIPEETRWYAHRWEGSWSTVSLLLVFGQFAVPFFTLLPRGSKRSPAVLAVACTLLVVMHYVDIYWIVMPEEHRGGFSFHWLDVVALAGVGGVFLAALSWRLGAAPLVPAKDPFLSASMEFENA